MNDQPRILAGRYEVGDLIGRGGMAEVHIGYDTRLGRTVAVKILRADLARDPSFQTRFRREAQAAAGLNHPAIVAVYDTGEDTVTGENGNPQAVPFIVMEYVEGHTVRDILKGDVAAPIDEAIEITTGVLTALEYSHHAGLVHRDIKPANIMLTPTGAVKVMDFGIARALADAGQTMTQSQAVVGTAQYLSPEQARGENVDARSDLYSTGCVLFELLTGRPPFVGDSPVSVAYQHVREEAPRPSDFASDVPPELDQVVLRALTKDRDQRFGSAAEFLADLRAVSSGAPVNPSTGAIAMGSAALGAGAAGVAAASMSPEEIEDQPTQLMSPTDAPATSGTEVMPAAAAAGWGAVGAGGPPGSVPPPSGQVDVNGPSDEMVADDARRRRTIMYLILAAVAALAIILIILLFSITRGDGSDPEPTAGAVTVPNLELFTEDEARTALEELGLVPEFAAEASEDVPIDRVIRTDPPAGSGVDEGETVLVLMSSGPDVVEVPSVRGRLEEDAVRALEEAGLRVTTFEVDHDPELDAGRATRTEPVEGEEVPADSEITLFVASGKVALPDLVGASEEDARRQLNELRLTPSITDVEDDSVPEGEVLGQEPGPGLVDRGTTVTLRVAVTPTTVEVPNVVGKTQSTATTELQAAGLNVSTQSQASNSVPNGTVISQNPSAGIEVARGTTVTITVSTGPPSSPSPGP